MDLNTKTNTYQILTNTCKTNTRPIHTHTGVYLCIQTTDFCPDTTAATCPNPSGLRLPSRRRTVVSHRY